MTSTTECPPLFACVDHDRTCRGRVAFCEIDEEGWSYPRCRRHEVSWRRARREDPNLKTL